MPEDDFELVILSNLYLLNAGVIGRCHQSWVLQYLGLKSELHARQVTTFPSEAHSQPVCEPVSNFL